MGGFFAIHLRRHTPILLALGAGTLFGAAVLDLMPEAFSLGSMANISRPAIVAAALLSFFFFLLIDKSIDCISGAGAEKERGVVAGRVAASLMIFHSFRDGIAIGASYAALPKAGYAVALGIVAHDFADGLNTVLLTTRGRSPSRTDYLFLLADAVAPLAGGVATIWFFTSLASSAILLAVAAGFFFQMAAYELLPELRRYTASRLVLLPCMLGGVLLVYLANLLLRRA